MKKTLKVLGIIAFLAIIGLAMGCEVDPEDQTLITITDLPSGAEGYFAIVGVSDNANGNPIRETNLRPVKIRNGVASQMPMFDKDNKAAISKDGYVVFYINTKEDLEGNDLYTGITNQKITLGKGEYSIKADKFYPNIEDALLGEIPDDDFFGTYKATYGTPSIIETIEFKKDSFKISDDSKTGGTLNGDFLNFTIQEWIETGVSTPSDYSTDYPKALLFKGIITDAKPKSATGPLFGEQTGPGLTEADITNKTVVKMYLYYNDTGAKVTFIRTTFVKDDVTTVPGVVMTTTGGSVVRAFTQQ